MKLIFDCVEAGLQVDGLSLNGSFSIIDSSDNIYDTKCEVVGYNAVLLTTRNEITPTAIIYNPNTHPTSGRLTTVSNWPVKAFMGYNDESDNFIYTNLE